MAGKIPTKKYPHMQCKNCGNFDAIVRKYHLMLCRRCFKELAPRMGFEKYD